MTHHPHPLFGIIASIVGNAIVWLSGFLLSDGFNAFLRFLGFVSLALSILNALGLIKVIQRKFSSPRKGKQ
ncbi:MAG: hypothetical protein JNL32_06825 [Candidatus Kapabacteria bacterium]|nr:hypothetical protein [Candidatus Kapabacteria bacterium]